MAIVAWRLVATPSRVKLTGMSSETDWQKFIESDPEIMLGKPMFKGTRITVEFILERLGQGAAELVFRWKARAAGVILLHLRAVKEADRTARFIELWPHIERAASGHFVTVANDRIRRTPLPSEA